MKRASILLSVTLLGACTPRSGSESSQTPADLKSRGQEIYIANCISCHNTDPTKDGAIGPAIKGSSMELLQARVLHAAYPSGYTPKRQTKQMVALPHLEKEISALQAFLEN